MLLFRLSGILGAIAIAVSSLTAQADAQSASPSPSPAAPSQASQAPSSGGSGGAMSIESTILAYQSLQYDANSITDAVSPRIPTGSRIVIASPTDIVAILQLRIVLTQLSMLGDRLTDISNRLYKLPCNKRNPAFSLNPVLSLFSTPSDISSMISAAASISAVTETFSAQSGGFLDSTLINVLSSDLVNRPEKSFSVYVPGLVPSNVNGTSAGLDIKRTYLFSALRALEAKRTSLQMAADQTFTNPKCKKDPHIAVAKDLTAAAVVTVDKFESAMFGGAFTLPSTALVATPPTPSPKKGGTEAKPSAISNTITISNGAQSTTPAPAPPGPSTLQQLLYVDFLLSELHTSDLKHPLLDNVYLLSAHALESGGGQLAKSQVFLGSRSYFSGGAAASFLLVAKSGGVSCGGITWAYRGYVKADDFSHAIQPGVDAIPDTSNRLPSTDSYVPPCSSPAAAQRQ